MIWNLWRSLLGADIFWRVYPITFHNDKCGSVEEHAMELNNLVNEILHNTGGKKVSIVTHSKGDLDARWHIAHSGIDKVANLIMIGTPNSGSPAARLDITDYPRGSDSGLFPGLAATKMVNRPQSTHNHAIARNSLPNNICWIGFLAYPNGGNCFISGEDDLLVPVYSAKSSPLHHYVPLG